MKKMRKRFTKLAIVMSVVTAGIIPGSCAMKMRDAALNGVASVVTNTTAAYFGSFIPQPQV
jgi:hypothetical protein